jgi:hypothetical protein
MLGKDFKKLAAEVGDDDIIVMSRDSEGNSFSPLAEASEGNYATDPGAPWYGEVHLRKLTPALIEQGYTEEDLGPEDAKPCICLWPTN